jgi:hypothetical protein
LEYPKSAIVAALIAIGFGIYYFLEMKKEKSSNANPNFIEATETGIHFSTSKGEITVSYSEVKELWHKEDNDETLAIIYTEGKERYEWNKDGFDSATEFAEFEKILNENCTNITNR